MKKASPPQEFYIGYEPRMPPALATRSRRVVGLLWMLGLAAAVAVIVGLRTLPPSRLAFLSLSAAHEYKKRQATIRRSDCLYRRLWGY